MNIHITASHYESLMKNTFFSIEFGSGLYGCSTRESDKDVLHIFAQSQTMLNSVALTHHNFQYKEEGVDHVFTSLQNFITNIIKGDSTVNYECLFTDQMKNGHLAFLFDHRNDFNNYNLLKAYLGIIKRDLNLFKKENNNKKLFHAMRGLWSFKLAEQGNYCNEIFKDVEFYEKLMKIKENKLSSIEGKELHSNIQAEIDNLRIILNENLNSGKLTKFIKASKLKEIDSKLTAFCRSSLYLSYSHELEVFDSVYQTSESGEIKY